MKILYILENYYPKIGGVEKLFCQVAEGMAEKGHDVTVITSNSSEGLPVSESVNGVKVRRLNVASRYLFVFLALIPAFKAAKNVDFIHTTSYNAGVPAWIVGFLRRKKVLITFHEVWGTLWFNLPFMNSAIRWLHYLFEQFLLYLPFHLYIAPSDFTKDALIEWGIPSAKVVRVYNGVEYPETHPLAKPKPNSFLFFGRLGMSKGIDMVMDAALLLKESGRDFRINMITTREPLYIYSKLVGHIEKHGLQDHLTLEHELPYKELEQRMMNASAVLIPSYSEGFCFAAVETMSKGIPLIVSGKGALKEVVGGKFIQMEDFSPEGLKNAMIKALENKWEHSEMKKFKLNDSILAYQEVYQKTISKS